MYNHTKFMNIAKDDKNLIVTIPLWQPTYDATGKKFGEIANIIGMIEGDEIGFAKVVELGYKDSFDYSEIIVKVSMGKKEFKKLCEDLKIDLYEYPICCACHNIIYGTHSIFKGKPICDNCIVE